MLIAIQNVVSAIGALLLEVTSLGPVAAGIASAFTATGAGIAMGMASGKALEGIARQPEAAGKIRTVLLLGLAFIETTALYGFVIAIIAVGS
jgi:F-type H+-transporting ATPase subunit c